MRKHLNRLMAILVAAALLFSTTALAASAADSEDSYVTDQAEAAQKLYDLGLMSGVATNPDGTPDLGLDRNLTRIEAITMLVKLLGHEKDAEAYEKASKYEKHRFEDVPDWADNIVSYAYGSGLTAGTSETTFGSETQMTATQYLTFLLKAIGYISGADFAWNEAAALTDQLGITKGEFTGSEQITRGDLAVFTCNALGAEYKDGSGTLLEHIQAHVEYSISDGVLYITGEGPMPDYFIGFGYDSRPWSEDMHNSTERISKVVVGDGITSIGSYALSKFPSSVTIELPEGICSIGDYAFYDSMYMSDLTIPSTVRHIGNSAFLWCRFLNEIVLPEGLERIEPHVFDNTNLREVSIPSTLTYIGEYAFATSSLNAINIPASLTYIDPLAFYGTPGPVTFTVDPANPVYSSVDNGPILLKGDGEMIFYPSAYSGDIVIPDYVKQINYEFNEPIYTMPVTSFTIPATVTAIIPGAFGRTSVTDIYYAGTEDQWAAITSAGAVCDEDVTIHYNSTGK